MKRPIYQRIASLLIAIENCLKNNNTEWLDRHGETLGKLVKDYLPSGSGFDNGTKLQPHSTPDKLVFLTAFHHMDEHGGYDGWTEHLVIATPSLALGLEIDVTGRNRNDIKDYIHDVFHAALTYELDDEKMERANESPKQTTSDL